MALHFFKKVVQYNTTSNNSKIFINLKERWVWIRVNLLTIHSSMAVTTKTRLSRNSRVKVWVISIRHHNSKLQVKIDTVVMLIITIITILMNSQPGLYQRLLKRMLMYLKLQVTLIINKIKILLKNKLMILIPS